MQRLPDAAALAKVRSVQVSVAEMYRLSGFPKTEPYFATKAAYRFDDPAGASGAATFGVLYVAQTPETAFCESILHGNALYTNGAFEVSSTALLSRYLVTFRRPSKPEMLLADLTGDGLKSIGLNNDISAGNDYTVPQQWASAIHNSNPAFDGIRYVSRQHNNEHCYALFNRCGIERATDVGLPDDLVDLLCAKFNVIRV